MTPRVSFGAGQTGRLTSHVDWALAGLFGERVIGWFVITKTRKGEAMFVCVCLASGRATTADHPAVLCVAVSGLTLATGPLIHAPFRGRRIMPGKGGG